MKLVGTTERPVYLMYLPDNISMRFVQISENHLYLETYFQNDEDSFTLEYKIPLVIIHSLLNNLGVVK